jgi:hypothetical protein
MMLSDVTIESVTVCVDYADFLAEVLPYNKCNAADYTLIVTDKKCKDVQAVCEWNGVHCISTDIFYANGNKFNKGAGINAGLDVLKNSDWVLHYDSDILFPKHFKETFKGLVRTGAIQKDWIYSVDRVDIPDYESWIKFKQNPRIQYTNEVFVEPPRFSMGVRVAKKEDGVPSYIPIGYCQLWNTKGSNLEKPYYPPNHQDAGRSDMLMAMKWPREKRGLIPEFFVYHLTSSSEMGINWSGRRSPVFGPKPSISVRPQVIIVEDDLVADLSTNLKPQVDELTEAENYA